MERLALVTGGTRGIGRAISLELRREGCQVIALYHGDAAAAEAMTPLLGISPLRCDVADAEACAAALGDIKAKIGAIDILVNNAGVVADALFHKMTLEQWRKVISVDLDSLYNVTRPLIEGMRARGFGRIINIASINGQRGQAGQTNYCAAKAGVLGFTRALALESAVKGITVNAVAPGYVETDMVAGVPEAILERIVGQVPVGRLAKPEEIARCVAFLASDEASFITGSVLSVNGGLYMA